MLYAGSEVRYEALKLVPLKLRLPWKPTLSDAEMGRKADLDVGDASDICWIQWGMKTMVQGVSNLMQETSFSTKLSFFSCSLQFRETRARKAQRVESAMLVQKEL